MLTYTIQYDSGDESNHVFSTLIDGENVEQAITDFKSIYKNYRILSVELVPQSLVNPDAWEKLSDYKQQARNRVINCLNQNSRR